MRPSVDQAMLLDPRQARQTVQPNSFSKVCGETYICCNA